MLRDALKIGRRKPPKKLAGDRPQLSENQTLAETLRIQAVIPLPEDQKGRPGRPWDFDREAYRQRGVV